MINHNIPSLGGLPSPARVRGAGIGFLVLVAHLLLAPTAQADIDVREELECLALTIYFEARGEPDEGKRAVGHVVMNRVTHPLFPRKVCNVVRQSNRKFPHACQFTWWCDGRSDRPREPSAWRKSKALARLVYWDYSKDPTVGALWYHAEYVAPGWSGSLLPGPKIGRHIFYRLLDEKDEAATTVPAAYPVK